ncbi:MAG TPA: hypothetical protein VN861_03755 [Candidatus Acidoferrales bacterium]|nr:hypothetical protein [Candidatus Acidoferrales bacterium]
MRVRRSIFGEGAVRFAWLGRAVPAMVMGLILSAAAIPLAAQDKKDSDANKSDNDSVGFIASKNASPKDIGLPLYPGSRRHKDDSDDSSSVQLGAWGGSYGFKLLVLKMESDDAPEKVAAFYGKALSKYGKVLNCSGAGTSEKQKSSSGLDCDSDQPEKGETVLKSGTKDMQHIASIKANGSGSVYDLVFIEAKGSEKDK